MSDIEPSFEQIKNKISTSLNNKLARRNIKSIEDITQIDLVSFSNEAGVGKTLVNELSELQNWILTHKDSLLIDSLLEKPVIDFINDEPTIAKIEIKYLTEFFPDRLFRALIKCNINTLEDLKNHSHKSLENMPFMGSQSLKDLVIFINDLKLNPKKYLNAYEQEKNRTTIPSSATIKDAFLDLLKDSVDEYIEIVKQSDPRTSEFFVKYFGLMGNSRYTLSDIGLFYDITSARVGQLIDSSISELQSILNGKLTKKIKIKCDEKVLNMISSLLSELKTFKIFSKTTIIEILRVNYSSSFEKKHEPYLLLLFEIFGIKTIGNIQSSYSNEEYFCIDKKIDDELFFLTGKILFDILEEKVLPISIFDLVIKVKKINTSIQKNYIEIALNIFPEIEEITINFQKLYQIRLDKLSSGGDMAERILFQIGKSTHIDEIARAINVNLFNLGSKKSVNRTSIAAQLKDKKHIVNQGKTGVYSFLDWEENTESISMIIRKAFLNYNRPISHNEIINYVKNIRPSLKETSIRTITTMDHIKLKTDKYILAEWSINYKNDIAHKEKNISQMRHDIAIEILNNTTNNELSKNVFLKKLENQNNFTKRIALATINRKKYFDEYTNELGEKQIRLRKTLQNSLIPKKNTILTAIKEYINNSGSNGCLLIDLVKKIASNSDYKKQTIYKIINENKNEFIKINNENKTWIKLTTPNNVNRNQYNWEDIQKELCHDLKDHFNDVYQHIPNATSFQDSLNVLKALIDATTGESSLDGLNEQLLPTFFKFYSHSNDKSDLLNYFKQISTSLDPFLKKVLFFVDNTEYHRIKLNKLGLGDVIKSLGRLDPDRNRYEKSLENITNYRFAEDMFYAYSNRNSITHDAKLWGKQEIVNNITHAISIYIYSTYEYFSEIESNLKLRGVKI